MTLGTLIAVAAILSFLAYRSIYYAMKLLAGVAWIGVMLFWMQTPPSSITKGQPVDVVAIMLFGVASLSFILWPWLNTHKHGNEEGASFHISLDRLFGREEPPPSHNQSRQDRVANYEERLRLARNGVRRREY
jgi:hypothetical protein